MRTKNTYVITSNKGGVAKTTTTIELATGLAHKGKRVLVVDLDAQTDTCKVVLPNFLTIPREQTLYATLMERKPITVHQSPLYPNLFVAPSHALLMDLDLKLANEMRREDRLSMELTKIRDQYDYVLIDTPRNVGLAVVNGLVAADYVLVVVSPGYFELASLNTVIQYVQQVKELMNPDLEVAGFTFVMAEPTQASKESLNVLKETLPEKLTRTVIPKNTTIDKAHFAKKDIFQYDPKSPAALAYGRLIEEVFHV